MNQKRSILEKVFVEVILGMLLITTIIKTTTAVYGIEVMFVVFGYLLTITGLSINFTRIGNVATPLCFTYLIAFLSASEYVDMNVLTFFTTFGVVYLILIVAGVLQYFNNPKLKLLKTISGLVLLVFVLFYCVYQFSTILDALALEQDNEQMITLMICDIYLVISIFFLGTILIKNNCNTKEDK